MADEPFLKRWSTLKARRAAHEDGAERADPGRACDAPPHEPPEAELLPPIETLGADSDYRAFLKSGVDAGLRRAALRRAWRSDEAVSGFRGMAEYDWDFNAPGYGALLPQDLLDIGRRAVTAATPPRETTDVVDPEPEEDGVGKVAVASNSAEPRPAADDSGERDPPARAARRHGGALPD